MDQFKGFQYFLGTNGQVSRTINFSPTRHGLLISGVGRSGQN